MRVTPKRYVTFTIGMIILLFRLVYILVMHSNLY